MPLFFPHYHINEVPLKCIKGCLMRSFKKWGLPRKIKVDNGKPFGDPQRSSVPEVALWLIGLGIDMIWNHPRCPRDNATVERMQRTTAQWAEPGGCRSSGELQKRLNEVEHIQTKHYGLRRFKGKTRRELYPGLWSNPRSYEHIHFSIKKVYAYLKNIVFVRRVSKSGCLCFYAQSVYVGTQYKNQDITVVLDPKKLCWKLTNPQGQTFACLSADNFCQSAVQNLNVCRKRNVKIVKLIVADH
jgi:hypothetical protein